MIDRRRFLKALGLGSMAAALTVLSRAEPRRPANTRAAVNPAKLGESQGAGTSAADARDADLAAGSVMQFRGEGGLIFVSLDDGATWTRHSHFGPAYRVKRLRTSRRGEVRADVAYAGRSFKLRLAEDGRAWRTA